MAFTVGAHLTCIVYYGSSPKLVYGNPAGGSHFKFNIGLVLDQQLIKYFTLKRAI